MGIAVHWMQRCVAWRSPSLVSCAVRRLRSSLTSRIGSWGPKGAPLCGDRHASNVALYHLALADSWEVWSRRFVLVICEFGPARALQTTLRGYCQPDGGVRGSKSLLFIFLVADLFWSHRSIASSLGSTLVSLFCFQWKPAHFGALKGS